MFDLNLQLSIVDVFDLMSYIESTLPGVLDQINSCEDGFNRASNLHKLHAVNTLYNTLQQHTEAFKNQHK